jgi:YD repeat-containing protein
LLRGYGGVVVATYTISTPGVGLAIIAGNNQPGGSGVVLPQPLTVQVTNSSGAPLANASVTFNVTAGGGLIAQTGAGTPSSSPITVPTNSQGDAYVFFTTANPVATTNTITATTSAVTTSFSEAPPEASQLPNEGDNSQGGASAPPGVYGVTPVAGPVPFNAYTGNGSRVVDDLVSPAVGETGLGWKRYLHTRLTDGESLFDFSGLWRHSYQWDFFFSGTQIEVVYPDGTTNTFAYDSTHSLYRSTISVDDVITNPSPGNYKLIRSNNQVYNFSSTTLNSNTIYYLSSIYDSKGNKTTLTWGNPVIINPNPNYFTLNSITEPGGNIINITYDLYAIHETSGTADTYGIMISQATASDGRYVKYNYNDYAPTNGTGSIFQFLAGATYSPSTAPTLATYNFNSFLEISSAQDTRAEGVPDVNFLYYDADGGLLNAETGTLLGIQDGSVANNAGPLYEANNITQNVNTAIVTYPDNSGNIFTAYTYTLDSQGNVLAVTNSDPHYNINATDRFAYTPNLSAGTVTITSTDGNGNTITTVKTLGGQILSRTYPIVSPETVAPSENWHYTTDSNNFTYLSSYTDANTNETQYFYAANPVAGQPQLLSSISYPDGTSESFFYNTTLAQSTPPIIVLDHHLRRNGGTEYFTYYTNGQLKTKQLASQTTGQFSTYVYETGTGRLHTITDANSNVTTLGYNDRGQVTQAQYAQTGYVDIAHSTRFYSYDGDGRFNLFTDELGNETGYNYDNLNRLTSAVVAPGTLNYTTTYSYDPNQPSNSSPTLIVSPTGKQESISYALIWGYKATSVTKKGVGGVDSATTINGYDSAGNLTSVEDPNLKTTMVGYDARNRKASVTDPALNLTQLFYDDNSNLTSVVSPDGTTVSHYDTLNRLKNSTDPKGQEVQMTYDSEGQLQTYTDPANSLYQYTYDFDERRLTMKYPDLTSEIYQYDAKGASFFCNSSFNGSPHPVTGISNNKPTTRKVKQLVFFIIPAIALRSSKYVNFPQRLLIYSRWDRL